MTWAGTMVACIMMFCAQTVVTMAIRGPLAIQRPRTSKRLTTLGMAPQYSPCSWRRGRQPAMVAFVGQDDDLATAARRPPQNSNPSPKKKRPQSHLNPGPVALSLTVGLSTLALQGLTSWRQFDQDAEAVWSFLCSRFPGHDVLMAVQQVPAAQHLALYAFLYVYIVGSSFWLMPALFRPETEVDSAGKEISKRIPHRRRELPQHKLTSIDKSYVVLNTLCMPGFFYHGFSLLRSWGFVDKMSLLFDYNGEITKRLSEAASFSDATSAFEWYNTAVFDVIPLQHALPSLALYLVAYELIYYGWHRMMHEVPFLYKWVHRHHHQTQYPDRPAIDTFNTGCVESQLGLYAQIGVLWLCGAVLGVEDCAAGLWFITLAGWLSVLEHGHFERRLPFGLFSADEHHMHHAFVKCNYSPYFTIWDKVFGTHKAPFDVGATPRLSSKQDASDTPPVQLAMVAVGAVKGATIEASPPPTQVLNMTLLG